MLNSNLESVLNVAIYILEYLLFFFSGHNVISLRDRAAIIYKWGKKIRTIFYFGAIRISIRKRVGL